jgi:hypothetical protein
MVRIHSQRANQGPTENPPAEGKPSLLVGLPIDLPSPSHSHPSPIDFAHLFLPEGTDLSRISIRHPLSALFRRLWLEVTLRALSSVPPTKLSFPKK